MAINQSANEIAGTSFRDVLPKGNVLNVAKAKVQIGTISIQADVDSNKPFIELRTGLSPGSYELKSTFITNENDEIPSYYVQIEKL